MPYSNSPEAILRVQSYLDMMVASSRYSNDVIWETDNPQRLSHQLREGLHAAEFNAKGYTKYSNLFNLYKIQIVIEDGRQFVKAILRVRPDRITATAKRDLREGESVTMEDIEVKKEQPKKIVDSVLTIEGAVVELINQDERPSLETYFPNFNATDEELNQLYKLAEQKGLSIINHGAGGLTLTKKNIGELKWLPTTS